MSDTNSFSATRAHVSQWVRDPHDWTHIPFQKPGANIAGISQIEGIIPSAILFLSQLKTFHFRKW